MLIYFAKITGSFGVKLALFFCCKCDEASLTSDRKTDTIILMLVYE